MSPREYILSAPQLDGFGLDPLQELLEREVADTEPEREVYFSTRGTLKPGMKNGLNVTTYGLFTTEVGAMAWANSDRSPITHPFLVTETLPESISRAIRMARHTILIRAYLDGEFVTLREINVAAWLEARRGE